MSLLLFKSSIMIYDRMNKKRKKLIGALFDKLWLTKASFILHVVRYDGWICCLLRQPIKLQWASIFLKSSIMINDRINKKRMKLIGALFDKFCHFGWTYRQHRLMWWMLVLFFSSCCCSSWTTYTYVRTKYAHKIICGFIILHAAGLRKLNTKLKLGLFLGGELLLLLCTYVHANNYAMN